MIPYWLVAAAAASLVVYLIVCSVCTSLPSLRTIRVFNKLPGPDNHPFFIGSGWDLFRMNTLDILPYAQKRFEQFGDWYTCYFMGQPTVLSCDPVLNEVILSSNKNIDKGPDYDFLVGWLQKGLLLSTGEKWRRRRKLLTPSFHFKILEDCMDCMNRNWRKVVRVFLDSDCTPVEPRPIMGKGALDIICESAMGTTLEDNDERSKQYIGAVKRVNRGCIERALNPLVRSDFMYNLTSKSKEYTKDLKILHDFTGKVIKDRASASGDEKEQVKHSDTDDKKRQAFLDSLLELSKNELLSENDIREEVDNFMFAGHDTASTALQYLMMNLGEHPEVQEKAYEEQMGIFGQSDRDPTKEDLSKMHYLDQVIKESLRLHPPAPQISRQLVEDVQLPSGHVIPASAKVVINIFLTHRNPKYWEDPDAFKPERFKLDSSKGRHPYSYIPFSAGPRNCIGQKFAMLEMKIGVSTILRSCEISAITRRRDLRYKPLIILEPSEPIRVEVRPRNKQ